MNGPGEPVTVRILEREYRVICSEEERNSLLASAAYLSKKMKKIRDGGKIIGTDRIAVMAALNITHELLQEQTRGRGVDTVDTRIRLLQDRIEHTLDSGTSKNE